MGAQEAPISYIIRSVQPKRALFLVMGRRSCQEVPMDEYESEPIVHRSYSMHVTLLSTVVAIVAIVVAV